MNQHAIRDNSHINRFATDAISLIRLHSTKLLNLVQRTLHSAKQNNMLNYLAMNVSPHHFNFCHLVCKTDHLDTDQEGTVFWWQGRQRYIKNRKAPTTGFLLGQFRRSLSTTTNKHPRISQCSYHRNDLLSCENGRLGEWSSKHFFAPAKLDLYVLRKSKIPGQSLSSTKSFITLPASDTEKGGNCSQSPLSITLINM